MEDLNNLNNDLKFVIDLCRIVILIYCLEKIFKVWIKNFFVVKKIIYRWWGVLEVLILCGVIVEWICKLVILYNIIVNGVDGRRFLMVWSNIFLFVKEIYIWVLN